MNLYQEITEHLKKGGKIQITTYTRSTIFDSRHIESFREPKAESEKAHGVYVRRGRKNWDYANRQYLSIRFSVLSK